MSRLIPDKHDREQLRLRQQQAALRLAQVRETTQRLVAKPYTEEYPWFDLEQERDVYLAKLVSRGYWVEPCSVETTHAGVFFTVRDMKQRKGRIFPKRGT